MVGLSMLGFYNWVMDKIIIRKENSEPKGNPKSRQERWLIPDNLYHCGRPRISLFFDCGDF